jgi:hypothetical protein
MIPSKKTILAVTLTLAFAAALAATSARAAVVYDLQDTLAASQPAVPNPAGAFGMGSYVTGLVNPADFALFTQFTEDLLGTGADAFYTNQWDPNVIYNDTGSTFSNWGITLQPGEVALGPDFGPTVVRFTAPTSGYYDVIADFARVQFTNDLAYSYVYHNATLLGSNTADDTFNYSTSSLLLSAGDTIDFVVGGPGSGVASTSLAATVTFTAVPEPSTAAFLGLGLMVVFAGKTFRRNRI